MTEKPKTSSGGPSSYYDHDPNWITHNDYIANKSINQWKEHSFHLGNISKALCRWGVKEGATRVYDIKKVIYSGFWVLLMLTNIQTVRDYLEELLKDPQFKERGNVHDLSDAHPKRGANDLVLPS